MIRKLLARGKCRAASPRNGSQSQRAHVRQVDACRFERGVVVGGNVIAGRGKHANERDHDDGGEDPVHRRPPGVLN